MASGLYAAYMHIHTHTHDHNHLQVLFKLDRYGQGEEVCLAQLESNTGVCFRGFTHDMFMEVRGKGGCLCER